MAALQDRLRTLSTGTGPGGSRKQFKWERGLIEDDPHSGRPVCAVTPEMCQKVEEFILKDRRVTVSQIAEEMGLSTGTVHSIIHDHLETSKVSARWVPRLRTSVQKGARRQCYEKNLELLHESSPNFFPRLVTGNEI
ncbi:hypothetical protein ILUMI_22432 [Ignelater luminosus]|uniref:Transposase n=1 Tax=Ignelater luminosus TaxID=2038154 RepID=A0A8K0CFU5_IGNLU|nr:hypothetical protein ILUMI_22432 [Ignelater luminosus]